MATTAENIVNKPSTIELRNFPSPKKNTTPKITELPQFQTMENVKEKTSNFPLEEEHIIIVKKVLDKLDDIKTADEIKAVEKQKKIAEVEIARIKAERELLKEQFHNGLFGKTCLALGPTFFLDAYGRMSIQDNAKGDFCNAPDEYIVDDVLAPLLEGFRTKFVKISTMISSKVYKQAATPVVSQVGSVVGQGNLNTIASNAITKAIDEESKKRLFDVKELDKATGKLKTKKSWKESARRKILLIFVDSILAPVKTVLLPFKDSAKVGCSLVDVHAGVLASLKVVDKGYVTFCSVRSVGELISAMGTLKNNAIHELKEDFQKAKGIARTAGTAIKRVARATPGAITSAARATPGAIRSGSIATAQGIKTRSVAAAQGIKSAASGIGTKFQQTFKKRNANQPQQKSWFSRLTGRTRKNRRNRK